MPGRVPAATLAAARRHLDAVAAARRGRAWLYVAPCPGPARPCTLFCTGSSSVPIGRDVLIILGQHAAAEPVAAAELAREAGRCTLRWLRHADHARTVPGWGWAAAGLAGALAGGWAGAAAGAGVFWVVSVLASWAGDTLCDLRAVRTEGYPAVAAGLGYASRLKTGRVPGVRWPRQPGRAVLTVLEWAAGPPRPPLRLRRALIGVLARAAADSAALARRP
jgi:hypothetical protein